MKKRAMKKWIPKNTNQCYKITSILDGWTFKEEMCPWWRQTRKGGYCMYLRKGDGEINQPTMLWDFWKIYHVSNKRGGSDSVE